MTTAILATRPAAQPGIASRQGALSDFVRLFALDCPPVNRRLVCHWRVDADGRLAGNWEPDIVPVPQL